MKKALPTYYTLSGLKSFYFFLGRLNVLFSNAMKVNKQLYLIINVRFKMIWYNIVFIFFTYPGHNEALPVKYSISVPQLGFDYYCFFVNSLMLIFLPILPGCASVAF